MKKQFVLLDLTTGDMFSAADWQGVYFSKEYVRKFDTEPEAEKRLFEEYELFPTQFFDKTICIVPVYSVE